MAISNLKHWALAIRPKTLPAAIAPVMIGTAMALRDGLWNPRVAGLCVAGSLAIQIGTNLANDYYDFKKGTDQADRLGPTRVTQAGLIKPGIVKAGFILFFLISAAIGYLLYQRGGQPIAIIAVASILSGLLYTAGPWPLGYLGLGDLFVLIFFGPVAVAGTYYVQALEINPAVICAGFAPGLLSMGILAVNNLRDIEGDRRAGKKTLAVRFGPNFARKEYIFCLITAGLIPVAVYYIAQDYLQVLCAALVLWAAIPVMHRVLTTSDGPSLNKALAQTGGLLLLYSLIFSSAILWPLAMTYLFSRWMI